MRPNRWTLLAAVTPMLGIIGCPSMTFVPPDGQLVFRDPFSGILEPGWTFTGVDASRLTLDERTGFARLYSQAFDATPDEASFLLREVEGDFLLRTRLEFQTLADLELAGLVILAEDGRSVALGLLSASGPLGTFRGVLLRADRDDNMPGRATVATDLETIHLRLERRGSSFIGSFSADGQAYTLLGTVSNDLPDRVQVGVGVGVPPDCSENCDQQAPADFDFFEIALPDVS